MATLKEELFKEFYEYLKEEGYDTEEIKEVKTMMESPDEKLASDFDTDSFSELWKKFASDPRYKNVRGINEVADAFEAGADVYNVFQNIADSKYQIRESERALKELQAPQVPSAQPKSVELAEATETARRDTQGPIREIDPLLQRNMDLLSVGMRKAETASAGQAGAYGALSQNAINQARRANIEAIPKIEGIRRDKFNNYVNLLGMQQQEDATRFRQGLNIFDREDRRYREEATAAGQVGAAGRRNLALSRQGLGPALATTVDAFGPAASNISINNPFSVNKEVFPLLNDLDPMIGNYGSMIDTNLKSRFNFENNRYTV